MSTATEKNFEARLHGEANAAAQAADAEPPTIVFERRCAWRWTEMRDLWRYRELLFFLAWRDIKVRYKQTALGAAWAVLQPFATMVVFSLFLGRMAGLNDTGGPYPLFVFAALLPWTFFANAIGAGSQSVIANERLVTKIYFPRLFIPMSAVAAGAVDFLIAFGMLLVMMLYYGVHPGWTLVFAPLLAAAMAVAALGVGALLAGLSVAYRDVRYLVNFGIQLWMFATPCIYLVPEKAVGPLGRALLPLNPAYGLIANFRAAVLGGPYSFDLYSLGVSSAVSLVFLAVGLWYFRRVERSFADII